MINDQPESQIKKKKKKERLNMKLKLSFLCIVYFITANMFIKTECIIWLWVSYNNKICHCFPTRGIVSVWTQKNPPNLASFTRLKFFKNRIKRLNLFIDVDLFYH